MPRAYELGEQAAREATQEARIPTGFPVDPFRAATNLGVSVRLAVLPDDVSGMVRKTAEAAIPEIFISKNDSIERQRFTCAHELGHYWLRRDLDTITYVEYRTAQKSPEEEFANAFAAELLMPTMEVARCIRGYMTTREMAEHFGVSTQAMEFRVKNIRSKSLPVNATGPFAALRPVSDSPMPANA